MEHSNKPLTSGQLKEMVGKPVWSAKAEEWFLICKKDCEYLLYDKNGFCISLWDVFDYGLYAQPPAHIDRDAWKPCEECESLQYIMGANYCEKCGRPLTDEAWDALEKRIGG